MVASSTALIHRNQQNPLVVLEDAFTDPVLRAFIQTHLGGAFRVGGRLTDNDIVLLENGQYAFAPDFATLLWSKLGKIATIVVAAAKGVHHIDGGIPRDVLSFEWLRQVIPQVFNSTAFPHLSLAH
ncbi:hypothetical protein EV360DRAFT_19208, partial [Lentinula raphanica]